MDFFPFLVLCVVCVALFVANSTFRFYCLSWFFPWLYHHPRVAVFLGIQYRSDLDWHTNRKETQIYISGLFGYMFTQFTGLSIETPLDVIKEIMREQQLHSKKITMEPYFDGLVSKKRINLIEFEEYLSDCILTETNRVFQIIDQPTEELFRKNLKIVRKILGGLTSNPAHSIRAMITHFGAVRQLIAILRGISPSRRLILLIPHLTLIDNNSKLLISTKGNMGGVTLVDFFDHTSKFFVFVSNGKLTFVHRHPDKTCNANNRVFGIVRGNGGSRMFCPGNIYTTQFIRSILEFIQTLDIVVDGEEGIVSNSRFRNIMNKDKVFVTFARSNRRYNTIDETQGLDSIDSNDSIERFD